MEDLLATLGKWVFIVAGLLFLVAMGFGAGTLNEREKAIAANVGKWIIDEKSGTKQFIYGNFVREEEK